jgi:glycerophosphoryl diester phosphodiesterase
MRPCRGNRLIGKPMNSPRVLVEAHRGASLTHPENTLAAFRAALWAGADSVELDLRLARDGVAVVIHDETIDRTTEGSGEVAELTSPQLQVLDAGSWKDPRFTDQHVPTLDEALDLLAGRGRINLRLEAETTELVNAAMAAVESRHIHHQVVASSIHFHLLAILKRHLPEIRALHLLAAPPDTSYWSGDGRFIDGVELDGDLIDAAVVEDIVARGKTVWAQTVDDPDQAVAVAAHGVAGITTSDPATILEALRRGGYR